MLSHEITSVAGRYKKRKRIGRGPGSGHGKTSGRGHKGSLSRSGAFHKTLHEGGQLPIFRRVPKDGFSNAKFQCRYVIVNIGQLEKFEDGASVGLESLTQAGLIDGVSGKVKILGDGELTKRLDVSAHKFSKSAVQKIAACGGKTTVIQE